MSMNLSQKLNTALTRCGLPALKHARAYRKIGAGAWHEAYLVYPDQGERLVVRLRRKIIYGRQRAFDQKELHENYAPVGLFYRQANRCWPGTCPAIYDYYLDPQLTFTIESYMGPALSLPSLTRPPAIAHGQQVGRFFREMYAQPAPLTGFGDLIWTDQTLAGSDQRPLAAIAQADCDTFYEQFDQLSRSTPRFDRAAVKNKLTEALAQRRLDNEPVNLVNGDITPENLMSRWGKFAGLVDPVPRLHNGLRYAAFFLYCYRSYLPNLADAPRYARHKFHDHLPRMSAIAEGYQAGYTQGDDWVSRTLHLEYFLWALEVAHENWQRLNSELTAELYLRAGDKQMIAARLERSLRELESIQLD